MTDFPRANWRLTLIPFSWLYGLVVWIRNALYDNGLLKATGFNLPVISVGNITVGGTGKTPHVEYLVDLLGGEYRVATLSRGYRRRTRDFRLAGDGSTAGEVGDEPLQMKRRFPGIVVAVDRKRVNGITEIMKLTPPVEVIVLDDAYQHRAVRPGLSILLIDYKRPIKQDLLLPAGMLREPPSNRNRADLILVTRSPERIKPIEMREYVNRLGLEMGQHLFFTTIRYDILIPVYREAPGRDRAWFREHAGGVLIVTGIANPRDLRQFARGISTRVNEMSFPDHHRYTGKDMERIARRYAELSTDWKEVLVLTTEKDAMKLRDLDPGRELGKAMYAVRVRVHFLNEDQEEFDKYIKHYVAGNKRSSILHQAAD